MLARATAASLLLAISTTAIQAAEPVGQPLRVISYNVQFLPGPASIANKRKEPLYRAEAIGRKLASFDVVGLNEVFEQKPRETLLRQLQDAWGEQYQVVISPRPEDKRFMGGCAIASRLPFVATHTLIYSVGSSPQKYGLGADGFAAKGALHARIARDRRQPDDYVDVFTTHLEARDDEIREIQYRELAEFIAAHSDAEHPALVLGDMNTRGNAEYREQGDSAYRRMFRLYEEARHGAKLVDVWPALESGLGATTEQESSDIGHRIDYILLSNPTRGERLRAQSIRVNGYLDERVTALSDHSAVEAELVWLAR